jgi:dihydroorotate dehydrogenase
MQIFWKLVRFFLFRLDPEMAHRLTVDSIRTVAIVSRPLLRIVSGTPPRVSVADNPSIFDLKFRSRIGLAAGFDKDAELLGALPDLGFGFVEIGTVTPKPQSGNPKPRLFRDPAKKALFNSMGFNGAGARVISERIRSARPGLPPDFRIGINLGKNKDTPLEDAASDYRKAAALFQGLADYLVINVSSPNTPGLRSLQTFEALRPIVDEVNKVTSKWSQRPPLLLKLAPEIVGDDLISLVSAFEKAGSGSRIDGWVFTNTLGGVFQAPIGTIPGGWSGGPLTSASHQSLIEVRRVSRLPIISVGGVMSAQDALERRKQGADLIQIYTGWIYGGPTFPGRLSEVIRNFDRTSKTIK